MDDLTTPPVLANFSEDRKTFVSCDANNYGIVGVLSQYQEDGNLQPVANVSRRLIDTEGKWNVSEIKLVSVVYTITYFSHFWDKQRFTVSNNHASLQYYKILKILSSEQIDNKVNGL